MSTSASAPGDIIESIVDRETISKLQWTVLPVALVLNMLDGFDVVAMAFTAHRVGEELAIAPEHLGIVFSAALAGMMAGAMFIAPMADVFGRRTMVLLCIIVISAAMIATGFSSSLWQLITTRLITGLGVGGLLASLASISAEYTPSKYRSLSVVAITAGYPLGATLGGFIAAPLLEIYGWQSVFFAGGLATLAMALVAWFCLPESMLFLINRRPKNALLSLNKILARMNIDPLKNLPQNRSETQHDAANVFSLLTKARRKNTLQLWLTFFFCFITLYFLMSWVPKLVVLSGMSESKGVFGAVAFNGGAVLGILALGWLASCYRLSALIALFLSITALCMLIIGLAPGHVPMLAGLFTVGFFCRAAFVVFMQ